MFNKIILAGNLTRDVEVKYSGANLAIGNTGIAVNRKFKSKMGEDKEEVLFVDLTFFGRTAEIANQYLRKGSKVLVEGKLKLDQWTDQSGGKRSKHSITVESLQMLDSKKEREDLDNGGYVGYGSQDYGTGIKPPEQMKKVGMKQVESADVELSFENEDIPF
jgi:single-strand DNA-binding protein